MFSSRYGTPQIAPLYGGMQTQPNVAGPLPGVIPARPYGEPTTPPYQQPTQPQQPAITYRPSTTIGIHGPVVRQPAQPPTNNAIVPPLPGTQAPATTQPAGDMGNIGNINTTITPLGVYPEALTEAARNQIVATQAQASDPRWLTKRFASPGRSADAGIASASMPFLAQGQFLGNQGYADLSLGDFLATQESLLSGEMAREREGLGLGNLLARLNEGRTASANSFLNPLLGSLLG